MNDRPEIEALCSVIAKLREELELEREATAEVDEQRKEEIRKCVGVDLPLVTDDFGIKRFKKNRIVEYLLDHGPFDMNHVYSLPGITDAERAQFAQLIGYSADGFASLPYGYDT